MSFGERLAALRKERKLTQDGLGQGLATDGADAGKQVVLGWEKNRHYPRADQLILICEKLRCSSDYLLFGKTEAAGLAPDMLQLVQELERLPKAERDNLMSLFGKMIRSEQQELTRKAERENPTSNPANVRRQAHG